METFCKDYEVLDFLTRHGELRLNQLVNYLIETSNHQSVELDLDNKKLLELGYTWMIYKWKIKIHRYPRSHEKIKIKTWASGFEKISAFREFEVYSGEEKILEASAIFLLVDIEKRKAVRIPEEIARFYKINNRKIFEKIERIHEPKEEKRLNRFFYKIQKRDLDFNEHVNNSIYFELMQESLPEDFSNIKFRDINVNYMKELKLGDEIIIDFYKEANKFYFFFKSRDQEQIYARICGISHGSN